MFEIALLLTAAFVAGALNAVAGGGSFLTLPALVLVGIPPVVAREAKEQNKTLVEHYAHLIVHGALHAQGWDHETSEQDAQEMEAYETEILTGLGFADPYAD